MKTDIHRRLIRYFPAGNFPGLAHHLVRAKICFSYLRVNKGRVLQMHVEKVCTLQVGHPRAGLDCRILRKIRLTKCRTQKLRIIKFRLENRSIQNLRLGSTPCA